MQQHSETCFLQPRNALFSRGVTPEVVCDKGMYQGCGLDLSVKLNTETRHHLCNTNSGQLIM